MKVQKQASLIFSILVALTGFVLVVSLFTPVYTYYVVEDDETYWASIFETLGQPVIWAVVFEAIAGLFGVPNAVWLKGKIPVKADWAVLLGLFVMEIALYIVIYFYGKGVYNSQNFGIALFPILSFSL